MPLFTHQYYSSKNSSENPHHSLGLFDECLSQRTDSPNFRGQYCTVFVDLEFIAHSKNYNKNNGPQEFINGYQESQIAKTQKTYHEFYSLLGMLPSIGFCLPSSCSAADIQTAIARQIRSRKASYTDNRTLLIVTDEEYCYTREKINGMKFDWSDYIMT